MGIILRLRQKTIPVHTAHIYIMKKYTLVRWNFLKLRKIIQLDFQLIVQGILVNNWPRFRFAKIYIYKDYYIKGIWTRLGPMFVYKNYLT